MEGLDFLGYDLPIEVLSQTEMGKKMTLSQTEGKPAFGNCFLMEMINLNHPPCQVLAIM